jgi:replicative superfamily II helicase
LLYAGVGLIYPEDIQNKYYTDRVLSLAADGSLAVVIADNSISYGTNYPFGRVIITEDFSDAYSVYTLFQLMGRAGRVGKSWKAEVLISDKMANMLVDFTRNPEKYDIEVENIKAAICMFSNNL